MALKRIQADYRALQREPLALATAAPRDDDWTLWDALIGVAIPEQWTVCLRKQCAGGPSEVLGLKVERTHDDAVVVREVCAGVVAEHNRAAARKVSAGAVLRRANGVAGAKAMGELVRALPLGAELHLEVEESDVCPLHFLIDFPSDYPRSAPSVGFSFQFPYTGGASYVKSDGRLAGKFVICLDLLGNFEFVHTEWKGQTGSGWSPAYGVGTLLLQLQAVLTGEPFGALPQSQRARMRAEAERALARVPGGRLELQTAEQLAQRTDLGLGPGLEARVRAFAHQHLQGDLEPLLKLLQHFTPKDSVECESVDSNIVCFYSGASYTEAVLGVGVAPAQKNLTTQAELLSLAAFDAGLRQGTDKTPFRWFLPVWVHKRHAEAPAWRAALLGGVRTIGREAFGAADFEAACVEVFPRLINQMVVEMMRPDQPKTEAIAYFEALANFWRCFRWAVEETPALKARVGRALAGFVQDEANRHKDRCPDLGCLLALFSVFQGCAAAGAACPSEEAFTAAYLDEAIVRNVLWWRKAGVDSGDVQAVFAATKVSREVGLFQQMVRRVLVGDVAETLRVLEATLCRAPERLEELQRRWRAQKDEVRTWAGFFAATSQPCPADLPRWLRDTEARAQAKGPKYAKGAGKGKGGKSRW